MKGFVSNRNKFRNKNIKYYQLILNKVIFIINIMLCYK